MAGRGYWVGSSCQDTVRAGTWPPLVQKTWRHWRGAPGDLLWSKKRDVTAAGPGGGKGVALFDMPNLNRFDILSISIFCKIALSISIFSKITISISIFSKITISISIFLELPHRYWYRYRYFSELPYRYWYRYRYFSKVSIYRQSICHIDISNRATIDVTTFLLKMLMVLEGE